MKPMQKQIFFYYIQIFHLDPKFQLQVSRTKRFFDKKFPQKKIFCSDLDETQMCIQFRRF